MFVTFEPKYVAYFLDNLLYFNGRSFNSERKGVGLTRVQGTRTGFQNSLGNLSSYLQGASSNKTILKTIYSKITREKVNTPDRGN